MNKTGMVALCAVLTTLLGCVGMAQAAPRLDPTFGDGGSVVVGDSSWAQTKEVVEDRTGDLVVVGNRSSGFESECGGYAAARVDADGVIDSTFGEGGLVTGPVQCGMYHDVALLNGRRPVSGGTGFLGSSNGLALCAWVQRLKVNGLPSPDWGGPKRPGFRQVCNSNPGRNFGLLVRDMRVDGRNRLVVTGGAIHGNAGSGGFVLRFREDGKLDPNFRGDARTSTRLPGVVEYRPSGVTETGFEEIAPLRAGSILAAGISEDRVVVARFLGNGRLDRSFGSNGVRKIGWGKDKFKWAVASLKRDRAGRILIGGTMTRITQNREPVFSRPFVLRLHASGRIDRNFGHHGVRRLYLKGMTAGDLVTLRNGKTLVAGVRKRWLIAAFNRNGTLDSQFFDDGILKNALTPAVDLMVDSEQRVVAAGGTSPGGFKLIRILP